MKTRPFAVLLGLNLGAVASFAHSLDSTLQLSTVPVWSQTTATQSVVAQPDAYGLWASGADIRMTSPGGSLLLSRDGYPTGQPRSSRRGNSAKRIARGSSSG